MNEKEKSVMYHLENAIDGIMNTPISEVNSKVAGMAKVSITASGNLIFIAIELKNPMIFVGKAGENINKIHCYLQSKFPSNEIKFKLIEIDNIFNRD